MRKETIFHILYAVYWANIFSIAVVKPCVKRPYLRKSYIHEASVGKCVEYPLKSCILAVLCIGFDFETYNFIFYHVSGIPSLQIGIAESVYLPCIFYVICRPGTSGVGHRWLLRFLAGGQGCPSSSGPEGGAPAENKPSAGHAGTSEFSPRGTYHTV